MITKIVEYDDYVVISEDGKDYICDNNPGVMGGELLVAEFHPRGTYRKTLLKSCLKRLFNWLIDRVSSEPDQLRDYAPNRIRRYQCARQMIGVRDYDTEGSQVCFAGIMTDGTVCRFTGKSTCKEGRKRAL